MGKRADVLRAEELFFKGLVSAQVDELEALLTDDLSLADLSGGLMSKQTLTNALRSRTLRFEAIQPLEAEVRLYGTTAIVTGSTEMRGRIDQTPFAVHSRYTHVYVEQEGRFYLAAAQGTSMALGEK